MFRQSMWMTNFQPTPLYINMATAFDTLSYTKLLYKLRLLSIAGSILAWIQDFLCSRVQCVRIGSKMSHPCAGTSGIPQGTILGSLFLLFVNDLSNQIENFKLLFYVDDVKHFKSVTSRSDCLHFRADIVTIKRWVEEWQMKIKKR